MKIGDQQVDGGSVADCASAGVALDRVELGRNSTSAGLCDATDIGGVPELAELHPRPLTHYKCIAWSQP